MPDWQIIAVLGCLIAAGHFLVRRMLKFGGGDAAGCGSCKSNPTALKIKPLVPLEVPDPQETPPN